MNGDVADISFGPATIFICYAHADNAAPDPKLRWLDRLLEFLRPLLRYRNIRAWSDKDMKIGESWDRQIRLELDQAVAAVLLVSPAFLASDYIARSEVPVLLKRGADRGLKIVPLIVSPCLYEETRFRYPDWRTGPEELPLGSLQSVNPPSRTLVEMTEGEQNRVLLDVARHLKDWLGHEPEHHDQVRSLGGHNDLRDRYGKLRAEMRSIQRHYGATLRVLKKAAIPSVVDLRKGKYAETGLMILEKKDLFIPDETLCQELIQMSLRTRNDNINFENVIKIAESGQIEELRTASSSLIRRLEKTAKSAGELAEKLLGSH